MDKVMEVLRVIEGIVLVVVPFVATFWFTVGKKWRDKAKFVKDAEKKKRMEAFDAFTHDESRRTVLKIKEFCNMFKDKSQSDKVFYLQLENGTIASSKLCNMFVTCLAEDDRYSDLKRKIMTLQRVPYGVAGQWFDTHASNNPVVDSDITLKDYDHELRSLIDDVRSTLSIGVYNKDGYLIGCAVFNYERIRFNGADEKKELELLEQFKTALETTFIAYYVSCRDKAQSLGLDSTEVLL